MEIMTAGLVILSLLVIYLLVKVITMKRSIRNIRRELAKTKEENYNRQVRTTLNDRDVEKLAVEINENLDYQKNLKLESAGSRRQPEKSIYIKADSKSLSRVFSNIFGNIYKYS